LAAVLPTLFGRGHDITALGALVQAQRLVSAVGPGGMGKTRLAEATARTLQAVFPDGAWLVERAPLVDPALLPAAVAQALAFALPGRKEARAEVVDALRQRALLLVLVLDNCEHVVQAAGELAAAVVEGAVRVHVLTTSRELLKVAEEHLYRLEALSVPPGPDLQAAMNCSAVSLFAERVHALMPGFVLSELNIGDEVLRQRASLPVAPCAVRRPQAVGNGHQERFGRPAGTRRAADRDVAPELRRWAGGRITHRRVAVPGSLLVRTRSLGQRRAIHARILS
jgi:hypothetical protein